MLEAFDPSEGHQADGIFFGEGRRRGGETSKVGASYFREEVVRLGRLILESHHQKSAPAPSVASSKPPLNKLINYSID